MTTPLLESKHKKRTRNNPGGSGHWYSRIQKKFMKDNETMPRQQLWNLFIRRFTCDLSFKAFNASCKRYGCMTGRTGCFENGHVPINKGTKGLKGANVTSFKKGHVPANLKPIGAERICSKDGYVLVNTKKGLNSYRAKHVVVWEKKHGPVPNGCVIHFKDENRLNTHIDNLECISRSLLCRLNYNHYSSVPNKLKPTVMAYSKLQDKITHLRGYVQEQK